MDYTLANRLKDAGFPMKRGVSRTWTGDQSIFFDGEVIHGEKIHYIYPTLQEVIDACGIWFYELLKRDDDTWYAGTKLEDNRPRYGVGTGSTPLEAVANLYLALHEKK